jgi:hypothetical protein
MCGRNSLEAARICRVGDVIAPIISAGEYRFGGEAWQKRRERRRNSTALSAPINYGPALKALGWLQPDVERKGAQVAMPITYEAITAFEKQISSYLSHPVFSKFGTVSITNFEASELKSLWPLDTPTKEEKRLMHESLAGFTANKHRRDGAKLAIAAAQHVGESEDLFGLRERCADRQQDSCRLRRSNLLLRHGGAFRFDRPFVWLLNPSCIGHCAPSTMGR